MENPAEQLRILLLEDVPSDAELVECELRDGGLDFTALRVDGRAAFEQALDVFRPDIVLADYTLPSYSGRDALEQTRSTHPHIPLIIVTGSLGDVAAVELLKHGARDYVLKGGLARLAPAIRRALSEERGIRNRKLAEGKYRTLFADAMDGILLIDSETGQIIECNREFSRQAGRTSEQLQNLGAGEILAPEQKELFRQRLLETVANGSGRGSDLKLQRPDGASVPVEYAARLLTIAGKSFIQVISRDISERQKGEQALRDSEDKFRSITASAQDAILMMDHEGRISCWNAAAEKIFGYTEQEAMGQNLHDLLAPERFHEAHRTGYRRFLETGEGAAVGKTLELAALRKDGTEFPVELSLSATLIEGRWHAIGILRDITGRKQAEALLKKSKDLLQLVVETAPVRIFWKDGDLRYLGCNTRFAQDAGFFRPDELTGKTDFDMGWRDQAELYRADDRAVMESGNPKLGFEEPQTTPEGKTIWLRTSKVPLCDANRQTIGILGIYDDITGKKQGEIALQHANRALATLGAVNRNLVHATDEPSLLQSICEAIAGQHGYRMAVVGYVQHDEAKSIRIMAHAGFDEGYADVAQLSWAESEQRGMGPSGLAVRSGETQVCQDIANDPNYQPWRDEALKRGYLSGISLPLSNSEVFGLLNVYAEEVNAFTLNEIALLEEMAGDLAFGVHMLRMRQERDQMLIKNQQQLVQLRDNLEDTVQAIATIVEMRDPYTAGHQARVAELSAAIATQMGLPKEQVHAVYLAGVVHDLGKIQVPAEILSKPGRITDIEYSLIKTHPQAGYDILKDIDFPWPIAQIVLQHHERLDGSGYPQGIKGEAILIEARILAVADVVEAISSHRPYRPGLGVEAALDEIIRLRGTHYDPRAVDACVALFREQGYTLIQ